MLQHTDFLFDVSGSRALLATVGAVALALAAVLVALRRRRRTRDKP